MVNGYHYITHQNNDWTKHHGYSLDMMHYLRLLSKTEFTFRWHPFDRVEWFEEPVLVKSRSIQPDRYINQFGSILLKLNTINHFHQIKELLQFDIPWEKKKSVVVWRGNPTGPGFGNHIPFRTASRLRLVQSYYNHPSVEIDIGLASHHDHREAFQKFYKDWKSLQQLLQYKYIISMEGNDVATNLKWALSSQSVVMMPPPRIESWIMEGHLIPFYHYIPLKEDLSDVLEKKKWCDQHQAACKKIRKNANTYMKQFMDTDNENKLHKEILESYLKNISIYSIIPKN